MTKIKTYAFVLWALACCVVSIGSLMPIEKLPSKEVMVFDKFLHGAAYFAIGFLGLVAARTTRQIYFYLIFAFSLGILIEFLQPLTGRSMEGLDFLANAAGTCLAGLAYWSFLKLNIPYSRNRL